MTRAHMAAMLAATRADGWESASPSTEQLAVARYGREWAVLDCTPDGRDRPAMIGAWHPTKLAASVAARDYVTRGQYR